MNAPNQVSNMPKIRFNNQSVDCEVGDNLRKALMTAKLPLYNGIAGAIHCRGIGTCGTCAVRIEGEVSAMTAIEKWRLGFPPHSHQNDLRLACQCTVEGDLKLKKFPGLWGSRADRKVD